MSASSPGTVRVALPMRIMGVVNVTPDSFSDGGDFIDPAAAVSQALTHEAEGADMIDIGGESTRPGHQPVGADEEWRRVAPVLQGLAGRLTVPVSIDTWRADTAVRAVGLGARIVNDVWGFQADPAMAAVVARHGVDAILMHNRREIDGSLDIIEDMKRFFDRSLALARAAGVEPGRITLDPGIGFGKSFEQNLDCIRRLPELKALGFPVLIGASRKSFLQRFLAHQTVPKQRLSGTLGAHAAAVALGADIIRVHDVAAHREMLSVYALLRGLAP
ncbi:MAG: dihydropteroate synthase [Alsobacter sp.]